VTAITRTMAIASERMKAALVTDQGSNLET
jgi:hypothetical protein